jgi:hypothetical protein
MTLKYLGKETTADEMGRGCGTYVREEKCMYIFGGGTLQGIGNFEDLDVGG